MSKFSEKLLTTTGAATVGGSARASNESSVVTGAIDVSVVGLIGTFFDATVGAVVGGAIGSVIGFISGLISD